MPPVNLKRVLLGGLFAGVMINVMEALLNGLWLEEQWAKVLKALGKSEQMSPAQVSLVVSWGLLLGIFAVWLYAAILPRFGPGPRTASYAGLAVWFVAYGLATESGLAIEILPLKLSLIALLWGLQEAVVATMAGAWLYKERPLGT